MSPVFLTTERGFVLKDLMLHGVFVVHTRHKEGVVAGEHLLEAFALVRRKKCKPNPPRVPGTVLGMALPFYGRIQNRLMVQRQPHNSSRMPAHQIVGPET